MYTRNCEIKPGAEMPSGMRRVALGVEYQGASFGGFQKQLHTTNTVQASLETALSQVANETVTLVCAGRTDSGVHASGQVVHFDTLATRQVKGWVQGVNTYLPDDIRISWGAEVSERFHARFSAMSRTYRYVFHQADVRSACLARGVTWVKNTLDFTAMEASAKVLVGEHDFSAFRSSQCQAAHAVRTINYIKFFSSASFVVMEIQANAFLHHMVRNIVGALLEIGVGKNGSEWLRQHLLGKDRTKGPPTASGAGLYLVAVEYPACFALPAMPVGPCFIQSPIVKSPTVK